MGLEKESLRVDGGGALARTPHPFPDDPLRKMDFAENQVEIVTPPCRSAEELYAVLYRLHKSVVQTIRKNGEWLWALSAPPEFGREEQIPIAQFPKDPEETQFREYLAQKYGRRVMLYSGIHFNFSYGDALLRAHAGATDLRAYKDAVYLKVAKYALCYSWFLVYLTAASPVCDPRFLPETEVFDGGAPRYASLRNSPLGYRNQTRLSLDLTSAEHYVRGIRAHVDAGRLKHISELYAPVRIKAKKGHSTTAILRDGIEFIELRVFDLNPFSPCGFALDDLRFLHLFMQYLFSLEDFPLDDRAQQEAEENRMQGARFDPDAARICLNGETRSLREAAQTFAAQMRAYFAARRDRAALACLDRVFRRIWNPDRRYAVRLLPDGRPFLTQGLARTRAQCRLRKEH